MKISKSGKIYGKSYFSRSRRKPKGGLEMGHKGPTPPPGVGSPRPRQQVVWPPWPTPASPLCIYQPPETLRLGEQPQKDSAASRGRKTPREKDLSGRQISAGGIPSRRGEIVAINTTIKLDFIGIIIIITTTIISISTIITAIIPL